MCVALLVYRLILNCRGVMIPPIEDLTADGYDLQFGVNVLGLYPTHRCIISFFFSVLVHFLANCLLTFSPRSASLTLVFFSGHFFLTQLLLPLLLSTASQASDSNPTSRKVRVITTSSLGHLFTPMNFDALLDRSSSGGEGEETAYEEKVKEVREKMGPQNLYMMSKYVSSISRLVDLSDMC